MRARPQRAVPPLARGLEPRLHGVRPAAGPFARPVARTGRRHRDGPGTPRERRPAGPDQLRHGPVHADPRPIARAPRARPRGLRSGAIQLPGHRRPLARGHVPHRRRRPAVERGPRLRAAPDPPPGRPARPVAGPARAVPERPRDDGHRGDGRGVSPSRRPQGRDPPGHRARGGALRADARRGDDPPRRGTGLARHDRAGHRATTRGPAGRRAAARRRPRVPPPRHLRLPGRPDRRARRRVRGRRRPARVRAGPGRTARPLTLRPEGRVVEARRAGIPVRRHPGSGR